MEHGLAELRASILAALGLWGAACGPAISIDGSAASGDEVPTITCEGAMPILQADVAGTVPTGWEICDDGVVHRVEAIACEVPQPQGQSCALEGQNCATDADCTAGAFGRCLQQSDPFFGEEFCSCSYGCATDADCDADQVCACGGTVSATQYPTRSRCIASSCTDDASCGNSLCALGQGEDGCGISYGAACLTPDDQCRSDLDCMDYVDCFPQSEGHWACEDFCCCGRPLLVDGCPVTAPAIVRADWSTGPTTDVSGLPAVVRRRIAEHYTQAAQLEHASVASFARFTLELMALGAPPSLLADAQRAGLDEIDHARRCFCLASSYGGRPVGPGSLATAGTSPATTLEAVARAVIDEACIGETLAAAEARAALSHATVATVRATLEAIAADEQRHAALGWRTLAWLLSRCGGATRDRLLAHLRRAVEASVRAMPVAMVDHDRAWLRAHGVLDPADRRAAQAAAIAEVLHPCAAALSACEAPPACRA
ncbi:ferritin-like domain-containing protein [Paraliomyxa miuraensis]|uniref:ferritin-like domain-containing protein n=1 Tax=Paraliomyxa miuraensis TaxID=376150 RepID=UPI0022506A9B|nr:ferritin-like domain-containing protein [Paraliomyxa miuraensis]MCX4242430.1 ferritin-like domain-containing protein [Paraliomyxa miuraensis]